MLVPKLQLGNSVWEAPASRLAKLELRHLVPKLELGNQRILDMKDVDLSYAGSFDASHPIHRHLARLSTGSRLSVENNNGKVVLKDKDRIVAVLSKQAAQLWSAKINAIESVTVLAMIRRYRDDSEENYRSRCKVERWELPLLEVVFDRRS